MKGEIIEKKISQLLTQCHINSSFQYLDVVALAKKLGFEVITSEDDKFDSFIILNRTKVIANGYNRFIFINKNLSAKEKRFLIAYELGHYILEYHLENRYAHSTRLFKTNLSNNQKNKDANYFACCLLMPKNFFEKDFEILIENTDIEELISLLSEKYKVSEKLVCKRLIQIGKFSVRLNFS